MCDILKQVRIIIIYVLVLICEHMLQNVNSYFRIELYFKS